MATETACRLLAKALASYRDGFAESLAGIEVSRDRYWYAQVLINRLLLLYDLQVGGWLGQGDRWYLHTQLGHAHQRQPDQFYQSVLLPLCHQGVGLPAIERPQSLQTALGAVPYLGASLFQLHPLEQRYTAITVPDEPFEALLGWLAEQSWCRLPASAADSHRLTRRALAEAFEYLITTQSGKGTCSSAATLQQICDRSLDTYLRQCLESQGVPSTSLQGTVTDLEEQVCDRLVHQILPRVTILDPACGSGRFLLMALERLQQLYQVCWKTAQTTSHRRLRAWQQRLGSAPPQWTLTHHILTHNLYGVDQWPEAVEITQLQLWLALLSTVAAPNWPGLLPDLDFNVTTGNALVGFLRVDEESFDRIQPKRLGATDQGETLLQGNLLQPLTAATYRDTLAEKQIRVEHYRTQTRVMAAARAVPDYVRAAFLRDRIHAVNQTAEAKLNRLLWETFTQKLGIQIYEPHPTGHPHKRLLSIDDIVALRPFHWGFFFHTILEQRGGFDVVVTHPPSGTLRPQADEFYWQHQGLFQQYQIDRAQFRRSRPAILRQIPALSKHWARYAGRFSCLRAYFRRSDDYRAEVSAAGLRSLPLPTLFACRCAALTQPAGVPPYLHQP